MFNASFTNIYRKEILFGSLYALAHSFIFHNPKLWWLAHLSLIPLLAGIKHCSSRGEAFRFGYVAGLASNLITFYWMYQVTLIGYLTMSAYLAVYPAIFALFAYKDVSVLRRHWDKGGYFVWTKIISVSSLWVLVEYAQTIAPVLGFGWGLMALSQTSMLHIIQIADIFGQLGISLVVVLNNVSIFAFISLTLQMWRRDISVKPFLLNLSVICLILFGVNYLVWQYADRRLPHIDQAEVVSQTKVALIQGNIPQNQKWNTQIKNLILDKYLGLSRQAAMEKPDLIIWPETSFPGYWEYEPRMTNQIMQLGNSLKASLLIGSPTFREGQSGVERMNSVIQLSPDGHEMNRHHKLRLVPYGEYIPFFKFIRKINNDIGRFSNGSQFTLFKWPESTNPSVSGKFFSVLICFEDTFADLCRIFVNKGARVLINVTNDGWFGSSTAAFQHAQASVLRAVENRVPVLRAANTGISCFIDPSGRIVAYFEEGGSPIQVTGFLNVQVDLKAIPKTFYTQYGESWILILFLIWLGMMLVYHPHLEPPTKKDYGY